MNDLAEVNRLLWPVAIFAFFPGVGLLVRCQGDCTSIGNSHSFGVSDSSDQMAVQGLIIIISQKILLGSKDTILASDWVMPTIIWLYSTVTGNNLYNISCKVWEFQRMWHR
jgi:hypothetical protein